MSDPSILLETMIKAIEEGFSPDGILSVPEMGLEDAAYRPGLAGLSDRVAVVRSGYDSRETLRVLRRPKPSEPYQTSHGTPEVGPFASGGDPPGGDEPKGPGDGPDGHGREDDAPGPSPVDSKLNEADSEVRIIMCSGFAVANNKGVQRGDGAPSETVQPRSPTDASPEEPDEGEEPRPSVKGELPEDELILDVVTEEDVQTASDQGPEEKKERDPRLHMSPPTSEPISDDKKDGEIGSGLVPEGTTPKSDREPRLPKFPSTSTSPSDTGDGADTLPGPTSEEKPQTMSTRDPRRPILPLASASASDGSEGGDTPGSGPEGRTSKISDRDPRRPMFTSLSAPAGDSGQTADTSPNWNSEEKPQTRSMQKSGQPTHSQTSALAGDTAPGSGPEGRPSKISNQDPRRPKFPPSFVPASDSEKGDDTLAGPRSEEKPHTMSGQGQPHASAPARDGEPPGPGSQGRTSKISEQDPRRPIVPHTSASNTEGEKDLQVVSGFGDQEGVAGMPGEWNTSQPEVPQATPASISEPEGGESGAITPRPGTQEGQPRMNERDPRRRHSWFAALGRRSTARS
ncbi:hypothetical protein JVU11DRAFT_7862 [Chiua virens]|nr:hypothetical protein JVU11DRAFT_7862 [Chiua virens]